MRQERSFASFSLSDEMRDGLGAIYRGPTADGEEEVDLVIQG